MQLEDFLEGKLTESAVSVAYIDHSIIDGWVGGWIDRYVNGWMDEWVDMSGWMDYVHG